MTYITKAENVLLADSTGKYTSESVEGALGEVGAHITNNSVHNNYALATGTNSYVVTLSPALTNYTAGTVISFKAQNENTGASTLNCNSLGAKPIYKNVNEELGTAEIKANQIITVVYDGTNFQIVSGSGGGSSITIPTYARTTLGVSSSTVQIPVTFNSASDILYLFQNSTFIAPNQEYTVSGTTVTSLVGIWSAGTVFDFVILQSVLSDSTTLGIEEFFSSYTAPTNGTTNCLINTPNWNPATDILRVYYQNLLLFETVDYTKNANQISIDLTSFSLNAGEIIRYTILRKVKEIPVSAKEPQMLGSAETRAIFYNSNIINENLTVSAGINAMSAGPITIANGCTVTVVDGARWVIV